MKHFNKLVLSTVFIQVGFAATGALAVTGPSSFPMMGLDESAIKLPGDREIDRTLDRVNEAWSALRTDDTMSSVMSNSHSSLKAASKVASQSLNTVKFQHYYDGLEVVGSIAMHQKSWLGSEVLNRVAEFDLDTMARLSESEAVAIALSLVGDRELSAKPVLKILPDAEGGGARLVYWIDIASENLAGGREVIIDANSGEVIGDVSKNLEIAPVEVFSAKNQGVLITPTISQSGGMQTVTGCTLKDLGSGATKDLTAAQCKKLNMSYMPAKTCQVIERGAPIVVQSQFCQVQVHGSAPVGNDPSALRAFRNAQAVLTYYASHHGRNSFDNRGSSPVNVVHAGMGFDNAYWSTEQNIMVYGDGDGKTFGDFTAALDVAGHEQTHGVVSFTAKFLGMGESGALNEAFADFFGKMIANDGDWAIGRKLFLDAAHATGVRNLANPASLTFCAGRDGNGNCLRRPFPVTIAQKMETTGACGSANDNCWVHANSTIQGHASYLVAQSLGPAKAEKLYYAALTQSLTSRDNLRTAAQSIKSTCLKVLDAASCNAVNQAYAQAGL